MKNGEKFLVWSIRSCMDGYPDHWRTATYVHRCWRRTQRCSVTRGSGTLHLLGKSRVGDRHQSRANPKGPTESEHSTGTVATASNSKARTLEWKNRYCEVLSARQEQSAKSCL